MKFHHYSVQTGWKGIDYNVAEEKGNIDVIAINRSVADLCVLVDYVGLSEIVKEIRADDPTSKDLLPPIPSNLMCGSKMLIAN